MKELKTSTKNSDAKNWTSPNYSLTQEEFVTGIQKAEKGPFHSVQQSMDHFETWLKSREKN
ncbi:MAG: hypothetical protein K9H26_18535 [Prolixibacteraceae bacterium]|nr:hypothetical protein [Prolixibacteraceae bacterium]